MFKPYTLLYYLVTRKARGRMRRRVLYSHYVHLHRDASFLTGLHHKARPVGVAVPKGENKIGLLNDLYVPAQRRTPAISFILRAYLC